MKKKQLFFLMLVVNIAIINVYPTVTLIDTPGSYPLGSTITADPISINDTIITISASNVFLDINDYILTQLSTNTLSGLAGIFVEPNLSNITIQNGTIENITGTGIYISDGCSQIYISKLLLTSCNEGGILFAGSTTGTGITEATITNCFINDCTPLYPNNAYGIRMQATSNIIIENCIINHSQTTLTTTGCGISLESCANCEITHCKAFNNGGTLFGAGMAILQSNGCNINNCSAGNNLVTTLNTTGTACGYYIGLSNIALFSNCYGNHSVNSLGNSIGFYANNNNNIFFENCIGSANIGGKLAAGLYSTNDNVIGILYNIFNINTTLLATGTAYGIVLNGTQKSSINGNTVSNNTGVQGYGLVDTTTDTNNLIISNLSFRNTTTGYVVNFTSGSLPVLFATNNNFAGLVNSSPYFNVAIV